MAFSGPTPLRPVQICGSDKCKPPDDLACYQSSHSTGQHAFESLLHELLREHQRCVREAAISAGHSQRSSAAGESAKGLPILPEDEPVVMVQASHSGIRRRMQSDCITSAHPGNQITISDASPRTSSRPGIEEVHTIRLQSEFPSNGTIRLHSEFPSNGTQFTTSDSSQQTSSPARPLQAQPLEKHERENDGPFLFCSADSLDSIQVPVQTESQQSVSCKLSAQRMRCRQFLESSKVELAIGCLILVNIAFMAVEIQYLGLTSGLDPYFDLPSNQAGSRTDMVFLVLERSFTVIFTAELGLRLFIFQIAFFKAWLNWIDFFVVVVSLLDWFYSQAVAVSPNLARVMRVAKVMRGLRLARLANLSPVLSSLHLLMKSLTASISTLSCSVGLLLVFQCVTGMVLSQLVHDFIIDESEDLHARQEVFSYYGTFSRSIITMFEVHLANFGPACRVLLDNVGEFYAYVFLVYRCFAGYAIVSVISGVFVQQTIKVAQDDQDVSLNEKRKASSAYSKKVRGFLDFVDRDGDGCMSLEELQGFETDPTFQHWMNSLEINTSDLRGLFRILDVDQRGVITAEEFLLGATRIKGPAKSVDMVHVLAQLRKLNRKVSKLLSPMYLSETDTKFSRQRTGNSIHSHGKGEMSPLSPRQHFQ